MEGHHDQPRSLPLFPTRCGGGAGVTRAGAGLSQTANQVQQWKKEAKFW